MQDWLKAFHGTNQAFPAVEIAVKAAVALALGLLVGFEREWSNKDIGVRTFAMTALLGLLATLLGPSLLLFSGSAVLIVIVFTNLRSLQTARKLEATTSTALAIVFLLGVLVGQGHLFTPVACAIFVAMLLALKPQLRAFAGGLTQQEGRSALLLGLFRIRDLAPPAGPFCRSVATASTPRRLDHSCSDRLPWFFKLCPTSRLWLERNLSHSGVWRARELNGYCR
jgi:hypothetical protein